MNFRLLVVLCILSCSTRNRQNIQDYQLPPIEPDSLVGNHLNNFRNFIDNAGRDEQFKVQLYGQSIIYRLDEDRMEEYFSDLSNSGDITVLKNAIGGFRASRLIRTASSDLYPEYPDLLIFHVYGGTRDGKLREFFQEMRQQLASDILIFDHHYSFDADQDSQQRLDDGQTESSKLIKSLAIENGFGLIEVRKYWKEFLNLNPAVDKSDLLRDNVHPNELGTALLEYIITQSIKKGLELKPSSQSGLVRTLHSNELHQAIDNGFEIKFSGNRLDLKVPEHARDKNYRIFLDGKPLSTYGNIFYTTRADRFPGQWYPAVSQIDLMDGCQHQEETWHLKFYEIDFEKESFKYDLIGEESGFEGTGTSGVDFISDSGCIQIKASDFNFLPPSSRMIKRKMTDYTIDFEVKPLFNDQIHSYGDDYETLVKLLSNKDHILKITSDVPQDFTQWKFKVYQPLKKAND